MPLINAMASFTNFWKALFCSDMAKIACQPLKKAATSPTNLQNIHKNKVIFFTHETKMAPASVSVTKHLRLVNPATLGEKEACLRQL